MRPGSDGVHSPGIPADRTLLSAHCPPKLVRWGHHGTDLGFPHQQSSICKIAFSRSVNSVTCAAVGKQIPHASEGQPVAGSSA